MTEWAIETRGLGHCFGKNWAVQNLDLGVPHGSVLGLLGPNGSGKSTTIHMLMGLLPPTEGSARVLGQDPVSDGVGVRRHVGYVAERHGFYKWMSVDETISLVSAYHRDWDDAIRRGLQPLQPCQSALDRGSHLFERASPTAERRRCPRSPGRDRGSPRRRSGRPIPRISGPWSRNGTRG